MVGLLYQGQYHLSPGFNYHLCGWHTNLLVCAELNPWVQSCITKATIFSAPKIRRHMHGLTTDCFFLICELFIWRLSKIQNSITFSCTFNEFTLPKRYLADVYQCHDQHEHTFILVASSWLNFSIINRKFDHFLYPEWGNLGQCLTPLTPCCTQLIGFQLITMLLPCYLILPNSHTGWWFLNLCVHQTQLGKLIKMTDSQAPSPPRLIW